MPRFTVLVVVIAASLVSGCVALEGSLDEKYAPAAPPRDTITETYPNGTAPVGKTDTDATSRALQCASSSSGRCTYGAGYRPIETLLVDRSLAALNRTANDESVVSTPPLPEVPPATFEGMWDVNPGGDGDAGDLCGHLIIEEPYVYLLVTEHAWGDGSDPGLLRDDDGRLQYYMIMLPRPGTRYDADTRSLWVYDEGPMTDGDHVWASGGQGHRHPDWGEPDLHQRNVWRANGMGLANEPHSPCFG